jgi:hypothetical protein
MISPFFQSLNSLPRFIYELPDSSFGQKHMFPKNSDLGNLEPAAEPIEENKDPETQPLKTRTPSNITAEEPEPPHTTTPARRHLLRKSHHVEHTA